MKDCGKEEGHFDGPSFFGGVVICALIFLFTISLLAPNRSIRTLESLPGECRSGEKVLVPSKGSPNLEYYECEANWVHK